VQRLSQTDAEAAMAVAMRKTKVKASAG